MAIVCVRVNSIYIWKCLYQVFVCRAFSACAFWRWHFGAGILGMRILILPFSGCAFSHCHSQDVHSKNGSVRMRILIIYFRFLYMLKIKSTFFAVICHVLQKTLLCYIDAKLLCSRMLTTNRSQRLVSTINELL